MNSSDFEIVRQMHQYCMRIFERIDQFGIDEDAFLGQSAYFDMLLMPIFQIGELVGALSDEFIASHQEIPWHAIRGFRNVIGHDYGIVDPLWAWNTVKCDIPVLERYLSALIDDVS